MTRQTAPANKPSHTPGPWTHNVHKNGHDICSRVSDIADVAIAKVYTGYQSSANARLIAAAPDLLAALETLLRDAVSSEMGPTVSLTMARAAIRKATGQEG